METLDIILDGDGAMAGVPLTQDKMGDVVKVIALERGTLGGNPTVALHVRIDGRDAIVETTWRLFSAAHSALAAKFGLPL